MTFNSHTKEYRKKYNREYRLKDPAKHKAYENMKKERNKAYVNAAKENPCQDCGLRFHPVCMEFHHRDPLTKDRAVATLVSGWSIKTIQAEIDKCDLLCSNCHALRHEYQRFLDNDILKQRTTQEDCEKDSRSLDLP